MESREQRTYLGVPLNKPRVALFDFSSCEGCQLQMINNEETLLDFLSLIDVVAFREAMTEKSEDYDIAFIEGSITNEDEVKRLKKIRKNAKTLVALGSCACFGGVNRLKNRFRDLGLANAIVYGDDPVESGPVRAVDEVVAVDLKIPGCPVKKEEVEKIVLNIALGKSVTFPKYPVCIECKANENICMFELGEPCLGPVTRAGCDSWCPSNRAGCWGCRGPAEDANIDQMMKIMKEHGFSDETVMDRLDCFGGFTDRGQETGS
jgi:coenzyme F420-reducing hydrogenase gamma subunit